MTRVHPDAIEVTGGEPIGAGLVVWAAGVTGKSGFTSAIAAYGAFFIPKSYGTSIAWTGGAEAALWAFLVFYLSCIAITWWFYTRRGGLLHDIERGGTTASPRTRAAQPAA